MRKDQLVFLLGGLAFGFLFGFGTYHTWYATPDLGGQRAAAIPGGAAPTGVPASNPGMAQPANAAPMVAEINQLKRVIQEDPQNVVAFIRLGNLHYDVEMWDLAAGYYEKAVELEPGNPDVITDLGACYRGMEQFDKALEMFATANQLRPDHHQSLFNTVIVAGFDLNQWERAEAALRALEAMNPKPPNIDELRRTFEQKRAAAGG